MLNIAIARKSLKSETNKYVDSLLVGSCETCS